MFDINLALHIAAPEALLAVGSMILLMIGAYGGEKLGRVVSLLAVALLIGAG